MSYSNDIDQAGKDPNIGKELTSEEKEALGISGGGSVSGTPNGFGPDDENKSKEPQKTHKYKSLIRSKKALFVRLIMP